MDELDPLNFGINFHQAYGSAASAGHGTAAIPTFHRVMRRFPTPGMLADKANADELTEMIRHLGLSTIRVAAIQRADMRMAVEERRIVYNPDNGGLEIVDVVTN
ncbi:unnamed protein product [Parascedosporium putredinis]|uniref:Uncharacterized protein n=1 Tax=Parascedosporium putredinis TaxID=1442378 RepID=A0A9P1M813_9PEZI|nr:unnamed protein product [Parascedosporium putredinis]CAI7992780.1 unnamed protein product [Parascedosporium putredinis]